MFVFLIDQFSYCMAISVSNKIAFLYDTFQKHMHSYTTKWQKISMPCVSLILTLLSHCLNPQHMKLSQMGQSVYVCLYQQLAFSPGTG